MARNKYPEETIARILQTALRLFLEKGYDHTTIQDIIDALGNLSKGAIYHHFKSKEDIFEAVMEMLFEGEEEHMRALLADRSLNGCEKLRKMFADSTGHDAQIELFSIAPDMKKNSRFLGMQLMNTQEVARDYVIPVIREGIADGSIVTAYPEELAEVLMLLANFWINPMIFAATREQLDRRLRFTAELLEHFGISDILGADICAHLQNYREAYNRRGDKTPPAKP